ncbi:MAG: PKD domain-containing protein [Candidatus Hydrogenedentes bacterium]|nr:PKD domain-containing protein [Candidatus Hydrogenedentota bacterium]
MPRIFRVGLAVLVVVGMLTTVGCRDKSSEKTPLPEFVAAPTAGSVPLTVSFTDRSLAGGTPIEGWQWDFGDGTYSTQRNPEKTYYQAGLYTVRLTVTSSQGNFTRETRDLVEVKDPTTFDVLGAAGGTAVVRGVKISVPAGVLTEETVFGVNDDATSVPMPSAEDTVRLSDSYTIQHNNGGVDMYLAGADGKIIPTVVSIPVIRGRVPDSAVEKGQVFVLARLESGRMLPIPAYASGGYVVAEVMRLPARAAYTAIYLPGSMTYVADEFAAAKDETDPARVWARTWKVNVSLETLKQLTALRLGNIEDGATFGRRDFTDAEIAETGGGLILGAQAIHEDFAESEIRRPALIEREESYGLVIYNMAAQYPPTYDRFSGLVYQDDFFGYLVVDPGQLLTIASGNAARLKADPEDRDVAQIIGPAAAFVEGIFDSVFAAYAYPDLTTTGDALYGLAVPADRDEAGNVRAVSFLEGIRRGGGAYLGQFYEDLDARGLEPGQFAELTLPLGFPYSPDTPDYAQSTQEFYFYLQNLYNDEEDTDPDHNNDPDYENPLYLLAGTLEGLKEAAQEAEEQGIVVTFPEALLVTLQVMNEVMEDTLPAYYWDYARDRAYENSEMSLLRASDGARTPYTLNEGRFAAGFLAHVPLAAPGDLGEVTPGNYPEFADILPLSARAVVFETNAMTTELTITVNAADWKADEDGNTLKAKVYVEGLDGVELDQPAGVYGIYELADTNEDGVNDTVIISGLRTPDECGRRVVLMAANLNLGGFNTLEASAQSSSVLDIPEEQVLREYVHACDPNYTWRLRNTISSQGSGYTGYLLEMTSGAWRGAQEVYEPEWRHYITVVEPENVSSTTALLVISGGSTGSMPSSSLSAVLLPFAKNTGSVVALLQAVPNQPLNFTDDTRSRSEDAIIAYSYDKYMNSFKAGAPDMTWPALLPMTRSAVKTMDALQDFLGTKATGPVAIDRFAVTGASKRGWTSWLTAASDDRVSAVMPIVIDVLGMEKQMEHHRRAYSSYPENSPENFIYGGYSTAIEDYVEMNVFQRFGTPESESLLKIVDPFTYRDTLSMPKLILNSTGDQFFLPDSSQFYYNELPGMKYVFYAPNTDHGLSNSGVSLDQGTLESLQAFYVAHVRNTNRLPGDDVVMPDFSWTYETDETAGKARIIVTTDQHPESVTLWRAENPDARDFRLQVLGSAWQSLTLVSECQQACLEDPDTCGCNPDAAVQTYVAEVNIPEEGWRGFFVQVTFPGPDPLQPALMFRFSTPVRVVPDTYPDEVE